MSYADLLKALIALGPKLPEAFARLQRIVAECQELAAFLSGKEAIFGAMPMELTVAEQSLESEACEALTGVECESLEPGKFGAIGDGTLLRTLFTVIRDNPDLLKLVIALLVK